MQRNIVRNGIIRQYQQYSNKSVHWSVYPSPVPSQSSLRQYTNTAGCILWNTIDKIMLTNLMQLCIVYTIQFSLVVVTIGMYCSPIALYRLYSSQWYIRLVVQSQYKIHNTSTLSMPQLHTTVLLIVYYIMCWSESHMGSWGVE